jgi:hypothetical protein
VRRAIGLQSHVGTGEKVELMNSFLTAKTAPHLVLGIESGASQNEAITGFALRSRKVKADSSLHFSIEDLTAALSEIEQGSRDNLLNLRYTIPSDAKAHQPKASFTHNDDVFNAQSDYSNFKSIEISSENRKSAGTVFLAASIFQILEWNWDSAAMCARECLRLSQIECERDEALNILAASLAMTGDATRSLDALKKAVEGEWNMQLQVNLALIATEVDPSLAVEHMSYIVSGAKTVSERLHATRLAIQLWRKTQGEETGSDDDDDFSPLPRPLLISIQQLLTSVELAEEDFYDLGLFLARVDTEAFKASRVLELAHHSKTLSAEVIRLRADGFIPYFEGLGGVAARDPGHKFPWIQAQVDALLGSLNSNLVDVDEEHGSSAAMAFEMIDKGLDCSTFHRIALRFLVIQQLHEHVTEGRRPNEKLTKWYFEASEAKCSGSIEITPEKLEILDDLQERAGNWLAIMFHQALLKEGEDIDRAAQQIKQRTTGLLNRMTVDKAALKTTANKIWWACESAIKAYYQVIPLTSSAEFGAEMKKILRALENIKSSISQHI